MVTGLKDVVVVSALAGPIASYPPQIGDEVLSINGLSVRTAEEAYAALDRAAGEIVSMELARMVLSSPDILINNAPLFATTMPWSWCTVLEVVVFNQHVTLRMQSNSLPFGVLLSYWRHNGGVVTLKASFQLQLLQQLHPFHLHPQPQMHTWL
jgi:hypothetical protein